MTKKIIFPFLVLLMYNTSFVFASGNGSSATNRSSVSAKDTTKTQYNSILSIQPFSLIAGGLDLSFEQRLSKQLSVRLNFGYFLSADPIGYDSSFEDMDGFRGELQLRRYINSDKRKTPEGIYIAPYALYRQIKMSEEYWDWNPNTGESTVTKLNREASAASGGLVIGAQYISKARITLDIFAGGGVYIPIEDSAADDVNIPVVNPYKKTISPRFGFSIGVAL